MHLKGAVLMKNNEKEGMLLVYTRKPVEGSYTASLGNSVHMAYSADGVTYEPLNQNYGMILHLLPSARIIQLMKKD